MQILGRFIGRSVHIWFFMMCLVLCLAQGMYAQNCNDITLTASQGPGFKTITLSWNGIGPSQHGYDIWMKPENGSYGRIGETFGWGGQTVNYVKTGLDTNKTYTFYVVTGICGPPARQSNEASAITRDIEMPGFVAVPGPGMNQVQYFVTPVEGVDNDNYLIFGRPTDGQFNNSPFVKTVPFGQTLSFIEGSWSAVAGTQLKTFRAYEFYLRARSGTRERDTPIQVVTTFDIAKPNLIGFLDANQKVNLS